MRSTVSDPCASLPEKMRRANPTRTTYGRPRTEMRIGSMMAAAFTFARTIDSKKPEGNRGGIGQAQLCSMSILLTELAKLCCSRAPLDGRCASANPTSRAEPQTRQFDPKQTLRVAKKSGLLQGIRCWFTANAVRLSAPCPGQLFAHAGDARADQRLVADEPQREADQDRREGRQPRPLRRLSDGGGGNSEKPVRRHPAADR